VFGGDNLLDRKCDLGTAKLQRKKAQKQLFNLLYPHRKTLGKELGNLGKTSGILGTPSAHSWGILSVISKKK
jgi:hypothetical protein